MQNALTKAAGWLFITIFLVTSAPLSVLAAPHLPPFTSSPNPRQQINLITSYLDGSVVYGSNTTRAAALRTFSGGKLRTSDGNLLPYNTVGLPNANDAHIFPNDQLFLAGDVRANENVELIAVHTLFVREHNRLADEISQSNSALTDEEVYQRARQIVTAEIQVITYEEFLPALLGKGSVKPYQRYSSNINTGIANEFSAAAFRIGHTLVGGNVEFLDNDGEEIRPGLSLAQAFFNPQPVVENNIDPILKYLATDKAQEVDLEIVQPLRNFLFGPPGAGGFDLASLNIQRGRDHGLSDYNTIRRSYGLPKVKRFSDITSNIELQQKLKELYGNVDNIDLWVGGLAEDHAYGSSVGPTFRAIIANQFERIRNGDPYWYERIFRGEELSLISHTRLTDLIKRNSSLTNLQDNVFFFGADKKQKPSHENSSSYRYASRSSKTTTYPERAYSGVGINPDHPLWGSTGSDLLRLAPAAYGDGLSTPAGANRPSARYISNLLCNQEEEEMENDREMSDWVYAWGQFIDHDLDLTDTGSTSFNISVPAGDPYFDPGNTGIKYIPFKRSTYNPVTGM